MESSTWQVILAVAAASVLQSIAYAIREFANSKKMARLQTSMDGNTALTATALVSSGSLPNAAPCIPAVAKAVSSNGDGCRSAVDYAVIATNVAREKMASEGIPIQSQELLVDKLHAKISESQARIEENQAKIDDTAAKEARHSENNAAWVKSLQNQLERLQNEMDAMKAGRSSVAASIQERQP